LFAGIFPVYRYFYQWSPNPETANAFSKDLVAMGRILKNSPDNYDKYVIMYGGDLPAQTVKLIALENKNNKNIKYLWAASIADINAQSPAMVLFMENNHDDLGRLIEKYPDGRLVYETASRIWVYYIN
jgi:hypothetical protein